MDGDEVTNHYGESRAQRIAEFHRHRGHPGAGDVGGLVRPVGRVYRKTDGQSNGVPPRSQVS